MSESREDLPLGELDDHLDRDELRTRYYNLLQELRVVVLPRFIDDERAHPLG